MVRRLGFVAGALTGLVGCGEDRRDDDDLVIDYAISIEGELTALESDLSAWSCLEVRAFPDPDSGGDAVEPGDLLAEPWWPLSIWQREPFPVFPSAYSLRQLGENGIGQWRLVAWLSTRDPDTCTWLDQPLVSEIPAPGDLWGSRLFPVSISPPEGGNAWGDEINLILATMAE